MRTINIVGFAGSLRVHSYNRRLLSAVGAAVVQQGANDGVSFETIELDDVPLYNADEEKAAELPTVARLKQFVREADGLLIATPEYNAGLPAVTKNAVDWLSRRPKPHALDAKPVGIMGATPGRFATRRAQADLFQVLAHIGALPMVRPRLLVGDAERRFDESGISDSALASRIDDFAASFLDWVDRFR